MANTDEGSRTVNSMPACMCVAVKSLLEQPMPPVTCPPSLMNMPRRRTGVTSTRLDTAMTGILDAQGRDNNLTLFEAIEAATVFGNVD